MPIPKALLAKFEENNFYHVLCKSIADRELFCNDHDRSFFLKQYGYFISPFVKTYSYCLLNNCARFLIQPHSIQDINQILGGWPPENLTPTHKKFLVSDPIEMFHELIEQQFNRFFISHSLRSNRKQDKPGHLFLRPFKRVLVEDLARLRELVVYIHANPVKHFLTENVENYKWSSYGGILADTATHLCRNEVLDWFGGKENFINIHHEQVHRYYEHAYAIE